MKTTEIKNKIQELTRGLNRADFDLFKTQIEEIRQLEKQLKSLELTQKVNFINSYSEFKRQVIKELLQVGPISSDLITNDGKLNKSRRKGNEKLFDFCDKYKVWFDKYEIHFFNSNSYSLKFSLYREMYINGDATPIETVTLENILKHYDIPLKPLTVKQVEAQAKKIEKLSNEFKNKVEEHKKKLDQLNVSFFDGNTFFYQSEEKIKTYKFRY